MFGYWDTPTAVGMASHRAVAAYVATFFAAYLTDDAVSRERLARTPDSAGVTMTLEHREAMPPSITYDEFVAEVVAGRGEEAVRRLRAVATVDPDHLLLRQMYLDRLAQHLLFTWGLADEALPAIDFMIDLYPEARIGRYLAAEAQVLREDYAAAIDIYERVLEEHPDDANVKTRLESLRSRRRD
jgi:predicted Zn-dependent protease